MGNRMKKINFLVFIVVTLALVVFDVYKASQASFTHDESWTYLHYVNKNIIDILSYHNSYANNHILNTLLMKTFEMLFGSSELALRLPNILSHILYLVFTFKLFVRYSNKLFIPFFILANANPYLIDFFSLARGYGMAIGLMSVGLYYYCRYLENQKLKNHVLSLIFIGFASLASFTMLNVFLVMIFTHNIFQFLIYRQPFSFINLLHENKINVMALIFFSIFFYYPIQTIIKEKLIIVGGVDGFWNDTVSSLLNSSAYYAPYEKIIVICWQIFIIAFSVLFVFKCIKYVTTPIQVNLTQKIVFFFGMITLFIVLGTMVQHWLFGTPFLMGRFALFIYPLFILTSCFLVADIWDNVYKYIYKYLCVGFLFLISGICFTHTCYSLNTSWYYDWKYDMNTKKMLIDLNKVQHEAGAQIFSIGVTWIFEPSINFYQKTLHLDWLGRVDRNGFKFPNNYFYVSSEDLSSAQQNKVEIIYYFTDTKSSLVRYSNAYFVTLKTMNGTFLCVDKNSGALVVANRDSTQKGGFFSLTFFKNNNCAILADNDLFLSAELCQHNEITATRKQVSDWETFTMLELDSHRVAFKAFNEKYLSVDEKTGQIFASADSIGGKEKFEMISK